jgi:hypothetical protein
MVDASCVWRWVQAYGLAGGVHRSIEILLLALDLDISLIHAVTLAGRLQMRATTLVQLRCLETKWEPSEMGRPPRHMYRLTQTGMQIARDYVSTAQIIPINAAAVGA